MNLATLSYEKCNLAPFLTIRRNASYFIVRKKRQSNKLIINKKWIRNNT